MHKGERSDTLRERGWVPLGREVRCMKGKRCTRGERSGAGRERRPPTDSSRVSQEGKVPLPLAPPTWSLPWIPTQVYW